MADRCLVGFFVAAAGVVRGFCLGIVVVGYVGLLYGQTFIKTAVGVSSKCDLG